MKKIFGLTFVALIVCSAFVAVASASAEETLLAEWLDSGRPIEVLTSTISEGAVLFADEGFGSMTCEYVFDGSVGPNGEGETTEVLTLSGAVVALTSELLCKNDPGSLCENSTTDILTSPEKLPWHTELLLDGEGNFEEMVVETAYSVTCLVFGFSTTDECTSTSSGFRVHNVAGGVEETGEVLPKGSCSVGGAHKASEEFLAGNLTTLLTGTLEASSVS